MPEYTVESYESHDYLETSFSNASGRVSQYQWMSRYTQGSNDSIPPRCKECIHLDAINKDTNIRGRYVHNAGNTKSRMAKMLPQGLSHQSTSEYKNVIRSGLNGVDLTIYSRQKKLTESLESENGFTDNSKKQKDAFLQEHHFPTFSISHNSAGALNPKNMTVYGQNSSRLSESRQSHGTMAFASSHALEFVAEDNHFEGQKMTSSALDGNKFVNSKNLHICETNVADSTSLPVNEKIKSQVPNNILSEFPEEKDISSSTVDVHTRNTAEDGPRNFKHELLFSVHLHIPSPSLPLPLIEERAQKTWKSTSTDLMAMSSPTPLPPGFRFHPTDEELILHYLKNRAASLPIPVSIIAEVDIYKFDPWELPAQATFGDREWYFFSPRDRKYPNGIRPNRAAASGYWKATGTDKPIHTGKGKENIGIKKALVFYKGRPPKGVKTNWIMHEYRLAEAHSSNSYKPMKFRDTSMRLDDWVLCRIYKKNSTPQPMPALMDREQEDSSVDDIYSVSFQNSEQRSGPGMQKSISISDFLVDYSAVSHMLDNPPELAAPEQQSPLAAHPNLGLMAPAVNSSSNGSKMQLGASPELVSVNTMKRQRLSDDGNYIYGANFSNQFGSSQCSLLNQSFFDQQLLNSQLGLH